MSRKLSTQLSFWYKSSFYFKYWTFLMLSIFHIVTTHTKNLPKWDPSFNNTLEFLMGYIFLKFHGLTNLQCFGDKTKSVKPIELILDFFRTTLDFLWFCKLGHQQNVLILAAIAHTRWGQSCAYFHYLPKKHHMLYDFR